MLDAVIIATNTNIVGVFRKVLVLFLENGRTTIKLIRNLGLETPSTS
jgi:hypothetical protein